MMPEEQRRAMDARYSARTYSLRELKEFEDWFEWQANALAAALLMPRRYVEMLLGDRRLTLYGKRLNIPDKLLRDNMSNRLGVSKTAMTLRLRQLGYAVVLPTDAYFDPTDIECDDVFS
jgi:Zn-dependent peptidase ImmA (M78 family)